LMWLMIHPRAVTKQLDILVAMKSVRVGPLLTSL
jgi:hypothetical protein